MRAVHVQVYGRVQGVGFRRIGAYQAETLGVRGWARNRPDGSVEAWLEGPEDAVASLLDWFSEGPGYASVRELKVSERQPEGHTRFEVRG